MVWFAGLGCRGWFVVRGVRFLLCVMGLQIVWGTSLAAQAPTPQDEPIHTLHVYTNLIQIPTLVLGPNRERLKAPIAESKFSVSIDSGPWFRATHVRQEGDDPISLSILLDVSGDEAELMPKIGYAVAALAPLSLHPKDHVSIYVLDCSLVRTLNDVPAESEELRTGVEKPLESWTTRMQNKHEPSCHQSVHLWDALGFVTSELYKQPGRRVILAVSEGEDKQSTRSWNEVRAHAQATGVAIFGLSYVPQYAKDVSHAFLRSNREDPFHSLCELSGGMVLLTSTMSLKDVLKQFVTMVRERYIVEFPRPSNATSGEHGMEVRVAKSNDFIRAAGITVPIPDAALRADPTTIRSGPTLTPEMGTRKTMKKPQ